MEEGGREERDCCLVWGEGWGNFVAAKLFYLRVLLQSLISGLGFKVWNCWKFTEMKLSSPGFSPPPQEGMCTLVCIFFFHFLSLCILHFYFLGTNYFILSPMGFVLMLFFLRWGCGNFGSCGYSFSSFCCSSEIRKGFWFNLLSTLLLEFSFVVLRSWLCHNHLVLWGI